MSAALANAENRQFGRRATYIRGTATIPGQLSQCFTIRNISDGGALLTFDEEFTAPRSFRIEITGTEFVLLCEVRHQGPYGVGVSFMRPAEGAALNRHFQLRPVEGLAGGPEAAQPLPQRSVTSVNTRELRQALQVASASIAPSIVAPTKKPFGPASAAMGWSKRLFQRT